VPKTNRKQCIIIMMNTKLDLKYLASVLDVRGTISVQKASGPRTKCCKRSDGGSYAIVQVVSRDELDVFRIQRIMGAKCVLRLRRPGTSKVDERVTVCGKRAAAVLRAVVPYMNEPSRVESARGAIALEDAKSAERRFGPEHGDGSGACQVCNDDRPKPFDEECDWLGDPVEQPSDVHADPFFDVEG